MRYVKLIAGTLFGVCILIIILWTSVEIPTYNINFYKSQFTKNNTYKVIGISESDLEKVTYIVIDYLKGKTDELNTTVIINEKSELFYNEKELEHMVDVQNLFKVFTLLRNACIFYCLAYIAICLERKLPLKPIFYILRNTFATFLCIGVALFCIIAQNFDYWFDRFHLVFFTNDLWQLDPATDNLINMVPLDFFISIAALIGVIFISASICMLLITIVLTRFCTSKTL